MYVQRTLRERSRLWQLRVMSCEAASTLSRMEKIPTIFERDWDGDRSRVLDVPNPACAWVFAGEGVPTQKYDGACCMVRSGLFKRLEVKADKPHPGGLAIYVGHDPETGKTAFWIPVGDGPEDQWFREAYMRAIASPGIEDGTYELLGPKVQGNPEHREVHELKAHADAQVLEGVPLDHAELADWFVGRDIEGVVWHHPDGRMAKIKARDFGVKRGVLRVVS